MSIQRRLAPDEHFGRTLGKYGILCRISTGGMSEIFLAFRKGAANFRKFVVLKQILPDLKEEESFLRMFRLEAKITAALSHPNIAQVFDLGVDRGELFIVMEYVHGVTLQELSRAYIAREEKIPVGLSVAVARDTASALHYVHSISNPAYRIDQVVHRDVAEKNVMVTFEGGTKLLDFGIAKQLASHHRTGTGILKGTPGYMSPEQIRGDPVGPRSDIFSLGVVLYQCLTHELLFQGTSLMDQMTATLNDRVRPPSELNPEVPRALDAVVLKAMEREPEHRFATAREFAIALEEAVNTRVWRHDQVADTLAQLFPERKGDWQRILAMLPDEDDPQRSSGKLQLTELLARSMSGVTEDDPWAVEVLRQAVEGGGEGGRPTEIVNLPQTVNDRDGRSAKTELVSPDDLQRAVRMSQKLPTVPKPVSPPPPKLSTQLLIVGGAGLLLLVLGIFIGVALQDEQAPQPVAVAIAPEPEPEIEEPPEEPVQEDVPEVQPPIVVAAAPVQIEVAAPEEAEPEPEVTEEEPPARKDTTSRAAPERTPSRKRPIRKRPPPEPEPVRPARVEPPERPSPNAPGFLSLTSDPTALVLFKAQRLGTTPLTRVPLPPGRHILRLRGPDDRVRTLSVDIDPGAQKVLRVRLEDLSAE